MKKGFTLIELLVVVLIIGILSSIALPQYQNAVRKARTAEAISTLGSLVNALKVCELEKGSGCVMSELAISIGEPVACMDMSSYDNVCAETKNFLYGIAYNRTDIMAEEKGGDHICICNVQKDGKRQNVIGQNYCWGAASGYEDDLLNTYSKLLSIPIDGDCTCCI